ncbi:caprin homolog [Teleopsis dalmanni]|uniref:caprin homolog n=1 Tax=Teleopsis dalmanni TaxID=139649 RepID=UPI0018CE11D4|nr:caprin homolog [Teleopsis dalmanni]
MPSAAGKSSSGSITATEKSSDPSISSNAESSTSITKEKSVAITGVGVSGSNTSIDINNPIKQSITTIEHKIRNLEKRKTKLESYRAIQATGKELSSDQRAAVAKYDGVIASLELCRDLAKQMQQFIKDGEKEQKKQARKDIVIKAQAETAKIREVLIIQNILTCFSDETIRADFLNGDNDAIKLEASDFEALDKFYVDVQIRRPETVDDALYAASAQKAAEIFSMTIDNRPKQYGETTFENLHKIFNQIQDCGYLDKIYLHGPEPVSDEAVGNLIEDTVAVEESLEEGVEKMNLSDGDNGNAELQSVSVSSSDSCGLLQNPLPTLEFTQQKNIVKEVEGQSQQLNTQTSTQTPTGMQAPAQVAVVTGQNFQPGPPSGTATPVHLNMYPQQMQIQAPTQLQQVQPGGIINVPQVPPPPQIVGGPPTQQRQLAGSPVGAQLSQGAPMALHGAPQPGHYPPTTVRAVEQGFFKQQYLQNIRPLAEVIGGGNFYFLQDSELDSPEIGTVTGSAVPVNNVVYDQQQQQTIQLQQQQQPAPVNIMNPHTEIHTPTELHKVQESHSQQQLIVNNMQTQQQPPTQPIPTQTFTNQSFPPIQHVQTPTINNNNTPTLSSTTPSPMFQQKPQLFSPVSTLQQQQQQLLHQQDVINVGNNAQQQILLNDPQQQPMMIMARLAAPQARIPPQQAPPQTLGMQPGDVTTPSVGFSFDNPVVSSLSYEQQVQQLAATGALKPNPTEETKGTEETHNFSSDSVKEWEASLTSTRPVTNSSSLAQTNATATAALTNVLKPGGLDGKWSTEVSSVVAPQPSNIVPRKNEWASGGNNNNNNNNNNNGGGANSYGEASTSSDNSHETNHWNSNQPDGGYGGRGGGRGPYQRRGDDRRDRDDRRDDRGRTGGSGGYRGRPNNYSSQQNGNRGNGSSGMYFRNNESSSTGTYYQNGGGNIYGKDNTRYEGSNNYRNTRNGSNVRGNGPPRAMGRNNNGSNNGGSSNASYMNPRQSNRMPMGGGLDKN